MGTTSEKLARLDETKTLLKQRLTEKGIDVASENNFYNLANKVGEIKNPIDNAPDVEFSVSGYPTTISLNYFSPITLLNENISIQSGSSKTIKIFSGCPFWIDTYGLSSWNLSGGVSYVEVGINSVYAVYTYGGRVEITVYP